jgi:hypothetical protein
MIGFLVIVSKYMCCPLASCFFYRTEEARLHHTNTAGLAWLAAARVPKITGQMMRSRNILVPLLKIEIEVAIDLCKVFYYTIDFKLGRVVHALTFLQILEVLCSLTYRYVRDNSNAVPYNFWVRMFWQCFGNFRFCFQPGQTRTTTPGTVR